MVVILILVILIFLILAFLIKYDHKSKCEKENYADQMAHGVVGGISGPLIDLSNYYLPEGAHPMGDDFIEKENYFYLPAGNRKRSGVVENFEFVKKGSGLAFAQTSFKVPESGNSKCSYICPNGYPKECPLGPKDCPYPCTGI